MIRPGGSEMYIVAEIPIKAGAQVLAFFQGCMRYAQEAMTKVPGCRMWVPSVDMTPPENGHHLAKSLKVRDDVLTVIELWDTVEDFENYLASDAKKGFEQLVGQFIAQGQPVGIRYLRQ